MSNIQSQPTNPELYPKLAESIPEPLLSPIHIDSPQEQPNPRSPKTKKIKKDNTL